MEKRIHTSIAIDRKIWSSLRIIAAINETKISEFLEELISKEVKQYKEKNLIP